MKRRRWEYVTLLAFTLVIRYNDIEVIDTILVPTPMTLCAENKEKHGIGQTKGLNHHENGVRDLKIFIAGARAITATNDDVKRKLSAIAKNGYDVLVGDASGADYAVQKFYTENGYRNVTVYAGNGKARNNLGNWKVEKVMVSSNERGFDFYKQKDIAMANTADYGFMIWNGESKGTLNNMINLAKQGKNCLVYLASQNSFFTIGNTEELIRLLSYCPSSTGNIYRKLAKTKISDYKQLTMF